MITRFPRPLALLLVAATLAVPAAAASAADLGPYRRPGPRYTDPPFEQRYSRIERWTGFYLGAAIGYSTGSTGVEGALGTFDFDHSGGMGALYAGYNWQSGMTVFGLEAEIGAGGLGGFGGTALNGVTSEIGILAAMRARLGILVTPGLLVYATGGLAGADFEFNHTNGPTRSDTFFGYQLGAGGELMLAPRWALRLEYLYTDLARERVDFPAGQSQFDPDFHTVRAGITLKF